MKRWFACVLLVLGWAVQVDALAAGVATVKIGGQTVTVSFVGQDARVDMPGTSPGYLLMRGGRLYMVMQVAGQPLVMDGAMLTRMMSGRAKAQGSPDMIGSLIRLEPVGPKETVAGFPGQVYEAAYRDEQGREHTGRAVLGTQPEVQELTEILGQLALLFQAAAGQPQAAVQQVVDALHERDAGLLAYGDQFRVELLKTTPPAPGTLDMPAPPSPDLSQIPLGLPPQ